MLLLPDMLIAADSENVTLDNWTTVHRQHKNKRAAYSYTLSNTFAIILFEIIFEISFQFIKATKGGRRGK